VEEIIAAVASSMPGRPGGELYEVVGDSDLPVEISDRESAEARDALMGNPVAMAAMAPMLGLLAAPFRATVVSRAG
jgi:hypothetical protein